MRLRELQRKVGGDGGGRNCEKKDGCGKRRRKRFLNSPILFRGSPSPGSLGGRFGAKNPT